MGRSDAEDKCGYVNSLTLHFTLIWLPVYLSTDARPRAGSVAG
jgi:hypothetical protein